MHRISSFANLDPRIRFKKAASPDYFNGQVRFDPVVSAPEPSRVRAASVTFEPGAHTAWHTHPYGQTPYVLSGCGRVQKPGEPIQEIHPGNTVWIEAGEKHWHGASPDVAMNHLAIQESKDVETANRMENVTDGEYSSD